MDARLCDSNLNIPNNAFSTPLIPATKRSVLRSDMGWSHKSEADKNHSHSHYDHKDSQRLSAAADNYLSYLQPFHDKIAILI